MRKMTTSPIETHIVSFLFHQHLTPHTSTGNSHAQLLLGRRPCSLLDIVRPDLSRTVRQHQESQKQQTWWSCQSQEVQCRWFSVVHNFSPQYPHLKWIPSQILDTHGPVSFPFNFLITESSVEMFTTSAHVLWPSRQILWPPRLMTFMMT